MGTDCRECRTGLAHCHGTIVDHLLGTPECTDAGCTDTHPVLHAYAIGCEAIGCWCGVGETADADRLDAL